MFALRWTDRTGMCFRDARNRLRKKLLDTGRMELEQRRLCQRFCVVKLEK
jgi:hypothetical protein